MYFIHTSNRLKFIQLLTGCFSSNPIIHTKFLVSYDSILHTVLVLCRGNCAVPVKGSHIVLIYKPGSYLMKLEAHVMKAQLA